jgi:hypothetical protein
MSEPDYSNVRDVHVPHEEEHAEATDAHMRRTSDDPAIANVAVIAATSAITPVSVLTPVTAISPVAAPSAGYVEGEALAARNAINFLITQGAATEGNVVSLDAKVNSLITQAAATEANVISLDAKLNLILNLLREAELLPTS